MNCRPFNYATFDVVEPEESVTHRLKPGDSVRIAVGPETSYVNKAFVAGGGTDHSEIGIIWKIPEDSGRVWHNHSELSSPSISME